MPHDQEELWTAVDSYLTHTLLPADSVLDAALAANAAAGLPATALQTVESKSCDAFAIALIL